MLRNRIILVPKNLTISGIKLNTDSNPGASRHLRDKIIMTLQTSRENKVNSLE